MSLQPEDHTHKNKLVVLLTACPEHDKLDFIAIKLNNKKGTNINQILNFIETAFIGHIQQATTLDSHTTAELLRHLKVTIKITAIFGTNFMRSLNNHKKMKQRY